MTRTALDTFEKQYGYPSGGPRPDYVDVLKHLGNVVTDGLYGAAPSIIKELTILGRQQGLRGHLQYLFYIFIRESKNWPTMNSASRNALHIAREVLIKAGKAPPYDDGLTIPPGSLEGPLNQVLLDMAAWCQTKWAGEILGVYWTALKDHIPLIRRALPDLQRGKEFSYLKVTFERYLRDHYVAIPNGELLSRVVMVLF